MNPALRDLVAALWPLTITMWGLNQTAVDQERMRRGRAEVWERREMGSTAECANHDR